MTTPDSFPDLVLFIVSSYARAWLSGLVAFGPNARRAATLRFEELAVVFRNNDLPRFGVHCLEKAARLSPRNGRIHMELGKLYYDQGMLEKARSSFHRATFLKAEDAPWWLGTTLHRLGQLRDAVYYYRQYLSDGGTAPKAFENLGVAFFQLGELENAIEIFRDAEQIDPKSASIKENFGRCLIALGRYEEASEKLAGALAEDPKHSEVHRLLGVSKQALGDLEDAGKCYEQAIERDPEAQNAYARIDLARIHGWQKDFARAVELSQAALEIQLRNDCSSSDRAEVYWELGWWRYLNGDLEDSLSASRKALEVDATLVPVRFNLGLALLGLGRQDEARKQYEKAANQVTDVSDLKVHGIEDLGEAMEKDQLPGADGIMVMLEDRYSTLIRELGSDSRVPIASGLVEE